MIGFFFGFPGTHVLTMMVKKFLILIKFIFIKPQNSKNNKNLIFINCYFINLGTDYAKSPACSYDDIMKLKFGEAHLNEKYAKLDP